MKCPKPSQLACSRHAISKQAPIGRRTLGGGRPSESLSVNASFQTALTTADKTMAARQTAFLPRPSRTLHDEGVPASERYMEALQKLQRTLQPPQRESYLTGEVLTREALPALAPGWEDLCARSLEDNVYYS